MRAWVVVAVTLLCTELEVHARPDCGGEARELRTHLRREASRAETWNTLWGLGFAAATVGQVLLAHEEINVFGEFDGAYREQMYVGAIKASLGLGGRLVFPLRLHVPAPVADECEDARRLRKAIAAAGTKERKAIWLTIIGGTIVNLSGAIWLWVRQDGKTAVTSFLTGVPIGPIGALTQPKGAMKLSKRKRVEWTAGLGWIGGTF